MPRHTTRTFRVGGDLRPALAHETAYARFNGRVHHIWTGDGKPGKKAKVAKKAPKGAKKVSAARDGGKAAKILDLLRRPEGATLAAIASAPR